jgi:uncharacterized protein YqgV (UPF0045/DUF77 family)
MSDLGIVNAAIQVLPLQADNHPYTIVDKAIELIHDSGMKYEVCPFETVVEGPYEDVMELVKSIQLTCMQAGAHKILTNLKIQVSSDKHVRIEDKTGKYRE